MQNPSRGATLAIATAALLSTLLGLVVMAAWHWQIIPIIQTIPNTPPMRYNTALGFLLGGLGIGSLLRGRRSWAVGLGGGVALMGILTLAQYIWGVDLGIDQLFVQDNLTDRLVQPSDGAHLSSFGPVQQLFLTVDRPLPGRASPNSALGLVFLGMAVACLGLAGEGRRQSGYRAITAFAAAGLVAIGTVALMGYGTSLSTAYNWRHLIGVSIPSAVVMLFLGSALLWVGLQHGPRQPQPRWVPFSLAFGIAMVSMMLWQALMSWYRQLLRQLPEALVARVEVLIVPAIHLVLTSGLLLALLMVGVLYFYGRVQAQAERLRRVNEQLGQTNSLLQATLDSTADGIIGLNAQGQITQWNGRFLQLWDIPVGEVGHLTGAGMQGLQTLLGRVCDRDGFEDAIAAVIAQLDQDTFAGVTLANGRILEQHSRPQWLGGRVVGKVLSYRDITERQQMEAALFQEKELAQVTLRSIGDAVITTDVAGCITSINPVAEAMTGWPQAEAQGLALAQVFHILHEETRQPVANPVAIALEENRIVELARDTVLIARDGRETGIDDSAAPIRDRHGYTIGAVMVFHDVTQTRHLTRQVSWQARHDALTGLANRREFEQCLEQALQSAQDEGQTHALCYLDLDQFKIVNDTCGHRAGDELLRQVTSLFQAQIRKSDLLARLGGDEFGILLHQCSLKQAEQVANTLREAVYRLRFIWQTNTFTIGVSIGLVAITQTCESLTELLIAADAACYAAKNQGRNRVHIFRVDDQDLLRQQGEMRWVGQITQALEANQFCLFGQPMVAVAHDAEVDHCEVLLRLRDATGALVLPQAFIPAAERYGLMHLIDRWVVSTLFQHWAALQPLGRGKQKPCIYAINLSGASIDDDRFIEFLHQQLAQYAIDAHLVCFEITETVAIANLTKASEFIHRLKALGCRFALDDFGTGMSSFAYLKTLPVDYLKIDGVFIRNIATDAVDYAIVEAISRTGQVMGLKTIAECVENEAILSKLRALGVDYAQGYGIARPGPLISV